MISCIDTSAWLDGWARDYPPEVFPSLWLKLADSISVGVLKCSEEVYVELERKDDGLHHWLKARKHVVVPIDEEIQGTVAQLLAAHPRLVDTHRNRSQADPFVIATAERLGKDTVVVTGEKPRGKLDTPKIPDVCEVRGLRCITFLEMLRELGGSSDAMTDFNESIVEDAALDWFGELSYALGHGPHIAPGEAAAERLRVAIRFLNGATPS